MTHQTGKILAIALTLGLGATACDQEAGGLSDTTLRNGVGTGTGLTLNTNQWVSSSARDIYEFDMHGEPHDNSYGYRTEYKRISLPDSAYGPVSTLVGAPPAPGQPSAVIVPGDLFAVDVTSPVPGQPVERLVGSALVGLRLRFDVQGPEGVEHLVELEFVDHYEHPEAGDFYEIMKVDPATGQHLAPLCEQDSDGLRMARIFDGLSVDGQSGVMTFVGGGIHHIACSSSAPAKALLFGYDPAQTTPDPITIQAFTLANRVVRADYCADGYPYTYPGNLLGIEDDFSPGQEGKTLADVYGALGEDEVVEAMWDRYGVMCMDTPRASSVEREDIVCPIKRFANGSIAYNWRPPSCEGFVPPPGGGEHFFSKGAL